ncbi:hypothetical protein [uncultured Ramlibacter sp.]|uniref:hypothetical protein n=1 Tax=uncultured Ramlibacter sp. TaxID=260755 RepID=UPI00262D8222|nr:hypothetical protein [uncultured Ramlibacter sp.]
MKTHDAFLRHLSGLRDRALAWFSLSIALTAATWSIAWDRGLHRPAVDGWVLLAAAWAGRTADRTALTLLSLCVAVGMLGATLISSWLFRRWLRRAQVAPMQLRGSRWEQDQ